ncbi:MAG: universal stress protein [Gemmatimonadaceae bacterium]|jgi:nucleotide-binding universal stress UspA family protein|nr:universal stress protein [Gemmatimonadaceae bacterium]
MTPAALAPYRTVLVPLDGSPASSHAIPWAAAAAAPEDGALYLARVHEPVVTAGGPIIGTEPLLDYDADADTRLAQADGLQAMASRIKERTRLAVHWALLDDGAAHEMLRAHAADIGADLIVMTTHGRAGVSRAVFGSVTTAVVAETHVPVLVLRPHGTAPDPPVFIRRVTILLDGSALAEQILEPARRLAMPAAATLELLRVVVPTPIPMAPGPMPLAMVDPDQVERDAALATAYLDAKAAELRALGATVTTRVERGVTVAGAVTEAAMRADVIAMATHARRGVARALLGSVAEEVVRQCGKPVLLFRPA